MGTTQILSLDALHNIKTIGKFESQITKATVWGLLFLTTIFQLYIPSLKAI